MTQQRKKMVVAVILAVLCSFLLFGFAYVFFPIQPEQHTLGLSDSIGLSNALWAALWIGLSILIAITVVGIMLLVNRGRTKKHLLVSKKRTLFRGLGF